MPSLLASSYILPFTGISLISERGQGCMILRHNLATDTLALRSPLPAHKFHFFGRNCEEGRGRDVPCRDNWPIHSSSTLHNPFLGAAAAPLLSAHAPCPQLSAPTSSRKWRHTLWPSHGSSPPHTCLSALGTHTGLCLYRKNRLHSWLLCKHYSVQQHLLLKNKIKTSAEALDKHDSPSETTTKDTGMKKLVCFPWFSASSEGGMRAQGFPGSR